MVTEKIPVFEPKKNTKSVCYREMLRMKYLVWMRKYGIFGLDMEVI
jgi:hypothetical protein